MMARHDTVVSTGLQLLLTVQIRSHMRLPQHARDITIGARCALTLSALLVTGAAQAQQVDLADVSLADLMNITVTSISKTEQTLFRSASAMYVITAAQLSQSGATSVADALRQVPGVSVGQLSGHGWRVGVRGFSQQFSDKLLVLVDGMSVYEPGFGGVWWGTFEPPLDNIQRIEIIRGPGAVVWGANAVNGVINIITKTAFATQGTQVSATAGSLAGLQSTARRGGRIGTLGYYRADVTAAADGRLANPGRPTEAQRRIGLASMRIDLNPNARDSWHIQAAASLNRHLDAGIATDLTTPTFTSAYAGFQPGQHISAMAQWTRQSPSGSSMSVRFYGLTHDEVASGLHSSSSVLGVEALRRLRLGRHDVVVSGDLRRQADRARPAPFAVYTPERHTGHQVTAFAQDEFALVRDKLTLTAGAKISDSDLTTVSVDPNVRLAWTPAAHTTFWTAFASADRIPTRFSLDARLTFGNVPQVVPGLPTLLEVEAVRPLDSERLRAYEAGYRVRLGSHVVVDTAAFVNRYTRLIGSSAPDVSFRFDPIPHVHLASVFETLAPTTTRGFEVMLQGRVAGLHLDGSYSLLDADSLGYSSPDPRHTGTAGASFMAPRGVNISGRLFAAAEKPGFGLSQRVPAYTRVDLRIAKTIRGATLALVGQNLTRRSHVESDGSTGMVTPVPRSLHGTVAWDF
jgi:iron complex outermembrane receptor protein